jgi:hypothetical protein
MMQEVSATITTAAGGGATVYLGDKLTGRVHAFKYAPGTLESAKLVITGETTTIPILTKDTAGTSTVWYYPRAFANKATDGALFTDVREEVRVYQERIQVVVTSGGNTLTGKITAYVDTEGY